MSVLSEDTLIDVVTAAAPPAIHPIREWLESGLLEEVGYGDASAAEKLNQRRLGRGISPTDFKVAKESAERTGRLGEELLDQFLQFQGLPGISTHKWIAQINAVSPYDFLLTDDAEGTRHADAKSTSGKFANPLYLSIAEIHHAVGCNVPYDIIRLYNVNEDSATFRIAKDIRTKLRSVLDALANVPAGVNVDSLSFKKSISLKSRLRMTTRWTNRRGESPATTRHRCADAGAAPLHGA